ncbi:hypothetical protein TNCV_4877841 [Trichonephila clavipes]|nr:hypothetical protein TNCV_4877841 [Trichonephila clavipes]
MKGTLGCSKTVQFVTPLDMTAGVKNSLNVAHAYCKRRLKWVPSVRGNSWIPYPWDDTKGLDFQVGGLGIGLTTLSCIWAYFPTEYKTEKEKEIYENLEKIYDSCPKYDTKVVEDLNAKVAYADDIDVTHCTLPTLKEAFLALKTAANRMGLAISEKKD